MRTHSTSSNIVLCRLVSFFIAAAGLVFTSLPSLGAGLEAIYFAEFGANRISRINPDGTGFTTILSNLPGPDEVAVDPVGGKIYFTLLNSGTVARANLDGTNVETVATNQSGPSGIALDIANGHVYWAAFSGFVRRANLDGSNQITVFTGGNSPDGLALDLFNGHVYFTNRSANNISRVNLDGTNLVNIPAGTGTLNGIAVDPSAGKIYFGSGSVPGLLTINYDGTGPAALFQNTGNVGAVEIDPENGHVYFGGLSAATIFRADLDGTDLVTTSSGRQGVFGIGLLAKLNRTVATVGTAAPGVTDATFKNFAQPVVNATGKVAFSAQLAGTPITSVNDQSLWATLGAGTLQLVAREGGPTGIAGVTFKSWGPPHLSGSHLFFKAKLTGSVTITSDDAIFAWNGTALSVVAREGDPSPVGGTWGSPGTPAVNDAGQLLFSSSFKVLNVTSNGLFRSAPNGGAIEAIVLRRETIQLEGEEVIVNSFTHRAANLGERLIANNGYVATVLKLSDGRTVLAVVAE